MNSKIIVAILLLFFTLVVPGAVPAQEAESFDSVIGVSLARTVGALFLVLALLFIFVYLLKRFSPSLFGFGKNSQSGSGEIDLIDSKMLAPRKFIYLVRVGKQNVLIGATENEMRHLASWHSDSKDEVNLQSLNQDSSESH